MKIKTEERKNNKKQEKRERERKRERENKKGKIETSFGGAIIEILAA